MLAPLTAPAVALENNAVTENNNGKVSDVTLYRNQALVTRTLSIKQEKGAFELVVGDLPQHIVADSLFAEGNDRVEIRAVQFRTRAVGDSPREEVRKLQSEIKSILEKIELNQINLQLLKKQSAYLDKLEGFVAPTASTEMSKGVLDAEALERMTKFSFEQRKQIMEQEITFNKSNKELNEQNNLLQRKLAEITNGTTKTVREAVLFVNKLDDGAHDIRLNYLVASCGWSPSYTLRAVSAADTVKLEYNSLIYQMTGENWSGVSLTLSTASPALSSSGPGLAPFRIALYPNQINKQNQQQMVQNFAGGGGGYGPQQVKILLDKQKKAVYEQRNAVSFRSNVASSWGINDAINQFSCVELAGNQATIDALKTEVVDMSQQPSLSYKLKTPVSLSSRNSQQMVRILQSDLPSDMYHVATPILTNYVYREAELSNNSSEDLLAGPITVYLEGRFVGRGEIPTVARGQTFVVGLGADSQLRTRRELADRTDGINGGNRELNFKYRLIVENFSDKKANIRLVDRLPAPEDRKNVRVTFDPMDTKLSSNKLYKRMERPEGILRWDIEVEPRSVGEKANMIAYGFTIEHDRNYRISLPTSTAQLEKQFEQLQRNRSKR